MLCIPTVVPEATVPWRSLSGKPETMILTFPSQLSTLCPGRRTACRHGLTRSNGTAAKVAMKSNNTYHIEVNIITNNSVFSQKVGSVDPCYGQFEASGTAFPYSPNKGSMGRACDPAHETCVFYRFIMMLTILKMHGV